jgi:glycerophosphoryl diester phosphodiesterase
MKKYIVSVFCLFVVTACNQELDVMIPGFGQNSILQDTNPLSDETKVKMEGIYRVVDGSDYFGSQVVIRWSGDYMSVFGEKNSAYFILQGGSLESVVFFEGYWRYAVNMETGLAQFRIPGDKGGDYLINDSTRAPIELSGTFGSDNDFPSQKVTLVYDRYFSDKIFEKPFYILAHRGGGRTADMLSASENTLNMFSLANRFGANAVEIDVKLSADRIPFLYHDVTLNLRLVQKSPIWGNPEDFTYAQLKSFITLINGEKIPSLQEALDFILENTTLNLVWLDMKSVKNDFPEVVPIQQDIMARAQNMGRQLEIFTGLPSEDKISQFLSFPDHESVLSLCELDIADVHRTGSAFWGPRWTLGLQTGEVAQMHAEGRRVITWTMDDPVYIERYIREGDFDGMVTNYPTLVAYYFYTQQ